MVETAARGAMPRAVRDEAAAAIRERLAWLMGRDELPADSGHCGGDGARRRALAEALDALWRVEAGEDSGAGGAVALALRERLALHDLVLHHARSALEDLDDDQLASGKGEFLEGAEGRERRLLERTRAALAWAERGPRA